MKDSRLLLDSFNIYYDKGMRALKDGNYDAAYRNILLAAQSMLELAKESPMDVKMNRIKRADDLNALALKIDEKRKIKVTSNNDSIQSIDTICVSNVDENITLDEALSSLNELEGLKEVKDQVSDLVDQIKVFQLRKEQGLPTPEISHHMVFTGNAGTGKTTVARIIGKIYKALGILSKGHLVEVDRSDLVAGYVGQTALKTKEVIAKSMGGVLFIDEAYSLKKEGNDFGQEAIDILNKEMEDSRGDLVVIVAGYKDEIRTFIDSNQGLRSRFRTYIDFKDYSGKELFNIFNRILISNKYLITKDAEDAVSKYLEDRSLNNFNGNARDVRNMFENMVKLQSRRLAKTKSPSKEEIATITIEDMPFNIKNIKESTQNIEKPKEIIESNLDFLGKSKYSSKGADLTPEDEYINGDNSVSDKSEYKFDWNSLPNIDFSDIAGLDDVKDVVRTKVLLPLQYPNAFDGYEKKNGGGLFLYGPPGTGKTMIAAAIANEIGAKFCSVKPSNLLNQGAGNTEKAVRALFAQAKEFPCAVIYFDEMDAIAQKNTRSSYSRQLRSELLAQMQGIESYNDDNNNLLFLICSTNKPWDVDSAFVRPGRFGTKVYVGLPDWEARDYMIRSRFEKVAKKGIVTISPDVCIDDMVVRTNGFNCSDITNLLDRIDEISAIRGIKTGVKSIVLQDVDKAFEEIHSSVQSDDIEKLIAWKDQNNI